ncbi:SMP-30/gluconolactonase/LRE family protein [Niveispirillum sp. KHB5.9]|uniref:SMP-30/gluconolactonase/LRE family protein n=1 Tax=Niveispirillum sp. KHB5.9 TaxID=3400269 RepID=UPI003A85D04B
MTDLSSINPECLWDLKGILLEGATWDAERAVLWFVDIKKRYIHRLDPNTGTRDTWGAPDQPGFVLPRQGGGLVVGMPHGLHQFDPATGSFAPLVSVETDRTGNRLNDGFTDATGRVWFGSMDDAEKADSGAFYRWTGGEPARILDGICITNGPATSPDGTILYHTDTLAQTVYAADILPDGSIANRRTFAKIGENDGYPDGMAVDSEGCVWVALFFGQSIRRYAPDGTLLGAVPMPVSNITKLAFGGPDLRTVYVTTASKGLSDQERMEQPLAGGLFSFQSPVAGLPPAKVRA